MSWWGPPPPLPSPERVAELASLGMGGNFHMFRLAPPPGPQHTPTFPALPFPALSLFLEVPLLFHSSSGLGSLGPLQNQRGAPSSPCGLGEGLRVEALEDWLGEGCWRKQSIQLNQFPHVPRDLDPFLSRLVHTQLCPTL